MPRLYTEQLSVGYGERVIVDRLTVHIPDEK